MPQPLRFLGCLRSSPVASLRIPAGKVLCWAGAQGESRGAECQVLLPSPRLGCSPSPKCCRWEMLGQKLNFTFSSPQRTSFPTNLFRSSCTEVKCHRHRSMAERGQQVDRSNYKDLSDAFVGCLRPRDGSSAQSLSLLWGNAAITFNRAVCALETVPERGGPFIYPP